jgi:hypothetical protein
MNMMMGAVHSPGAHTDAKLKYEDEMARRKYDRARRGARGAPGHIDDVAIGDEVSFSPSICLPAALDLSAVPTALYGAGFQLARKRRARFDQVRARKR